MATVRLTGATKAFGPVEVLKGIDLDIADGEFVVFVGPSGCGKSTLLRSIAGLETLTSGSIEIDGRQVDDVSPSARGIAMVFQSYALYPHMSVRENMGFALKLAGRSKAEIADAVTAAARTLDIEHLLDRWPKELSGGQRQRVAIGRAIVRQPKVFLFDEPLSNLDAALRVRMRYEFASLHRALGTTMIYVTHDQVEAMTLADRIVVLNGGVIEQVGTPGQLYAAPDTLFVAGFIGAPTMNLLPATVVGPESVKLAGGQVIEVATGPSAPGAAVTLGVRPEHLRVGGAGNVLTGAVRMIESLGSAHHIHLAVEGLADPLVVSLGERPTGETLTVSLPRDALLLFDDAGRAVRGRD
ncbi:sn-glycerol-3-phosphate ABC transporter ATP-binding protein UgpC [Sphingomonas panacisoli]|uniref:sn-glycerol-3-phosphate ABC transporter ATP-binding protein UgpC n=1 Tax=Sphingomonas panacisoli TaxID=1813879 RepID=A0A5B8LD19_9SPHN|nr:sn-glycerol-3-phosphate ABC transporter ATP-binding protein UgpC [Sphingomonas panacisoli]QDZ06068.1 sn-glycerol-3-phosphate ABC transporter ATP-binding protein UgpC [Sphingomonas panacisoli]